MMPLRPCPCPYGGPAPSRFGGRAGDLPRSPRWGCLARGVGGLFCLRGGRISAISDVQRRSAPFSAGSLSPRGFRPADGAARRDFAAGSCKNPRSPSRVVRVAGSSASSPTNGSLGAVVVLPRCHGSTPWRTFSAPPSTPPTTSSGLASGICCRGACATRY